MPTGTSDARVRLTVGSSTPIAAVATVAPVTRPAIAHTTRTRQAWSAPRRRDACPATAPTATATGTQTSGSRQTAVTRPTSPQARCTTSPPTRAGTRASWAAANTTAATTIANGAARTPWAEAISRQSRTVATAATTRPPQAARRPTAAQHRSGAHSWADPLTPALRYSALIRSGI